MTTSAKYKERDDAFGRTMLTIRTRLSLTQSGIAEALGVSPRTIMVWEAGASYPSVEHFKHFIELAVQRQAFLSGHEREEVHALWKLAHQRVLLDDIWLNTVLENSSLPLALAEDKESVLPLSTETSNLQLREQDQLLTTKFYIPFFAHSLIPRPRLTETLLNKSFERPLILVSAPPGFGKTTLLASWLRSLPKGKNLVAWLSLDEHDNDPVRFWRYILTALERQLPGSFTDLLVSLQEQQMHFLQYLVTPLLNRLSDIPQPLLLILDDYHLITEPAIHTTLSLVVEHIPPTVHLLLATRSDPPFSLSRIRAQSKLLEIRTEQLRCTSEETRLFLERVMSIHLPAGRIAQVNERTEGWIAGLQLLGLSLQGREIPENLLDVLSGSQHYILDFLTDEVLQRQNTATQTFLLKTSILGRLSASLCDAVLERHDSQQMLEQLGRANLFIVSLDMQRHWYRYHALFAEVLRYRLAQVGDETIAALHLRASQWYEEQGQTDEAITHTLQAHDWQRAADLIEPIALAQLQAWKSEVYLRRWIEHLPTEVVRSRPSLSLTYALTLFMEASHESLDDWLQAAETGIARRLAQPGLDKQHAQQSELNDVLGGVFVIRAFSAAYRGNGALAKTLNEQALTYLAEKNHSMRALIVINQGLMHIADGEAVTALQDFLDATRLYQTVGLTFSAIAFVITAGAVLLFQGRLHKAWDVFEQAIAMNQTKRSFTFPLASRAYSFQADLAREWNRMDETDALINAAVEMGEQSQDLASLESVYASRGYITFLKGERDAAVASFEQAEQTSAQLKSPLTYILQVLPKQVRFWIAQGKLAHATHVLETLLQQIQQTAAPLLLEQVQVARFRVLLTQQQPDEVVNVLPTLLQEALRQERFGHVIEMYLLQALAYSMRQQEQEALAPLRKALRLAKPEGYIRIFVDEGPQMASLLISLRKQERQHGATPYLDTLLEAFPQTSEQASTPSHAVAQPNLIEPLTERELTVLREVALGATNQQIAEKLLIAVVTVKSHITHIYEKLEVKNRTQAMARARGLGLLPDEL